MIERAPGVPGFRALPVSGSNFRRALVPVPGKKGSRLTGTFPRVSGSGRISRPAYPEGVYPEKRGDRHQQPDSLLCAATMIADGDEKRTVLLPTCFSREEIIQPDSPLQEPVRGSRVVMPKPGWLSQDRPFPVFSVINDKTRYIGYPSIWRRKIHSQILIRCSGSDKPQLNR